MAIIKNRFHFGPAGDIRPLPRQVRGANTEATAVRYGAVSRAISGMPTIVNYGFRRSWNLSWYQMTELEARELYRVEAAYRGLLSRSTYLLDTRNTNYLNPDTASVGGETGTDAFVVNSGTLKRVNSGTFHPDLAGMVDGHMVLESPSGEADYTATMIPTQRIPIVEGSSYLFSLYLYGNSNYRLGFELRDADGALLSTVESTLRSYPSEPTRVSYALNPGSVPEDAATLSPYLMSTNSPTFAYTSGWQLQIDESEVKPWFPGAGAAEVVVEEFTVTYPHADKRVITAVLLEV